MGCGGDENSPARPSFVKTTEGRRVTVLIIREIQAGKCTMVFSSRSVVGPCGVDFFCKVAEVVGLFVARYLGGPFFESPVPVDAFVSGSFV